MNKRLLINVFVEKFKLYFIDLTANSKPKLFKHNFLTLLNMPKVESNINKTKETKKNKGLTKCQFKEHANNSSKDSSKNNSKLHSHKILITSALPYANGSIHLGHLVEYIQTDIFVRFLKLIGKDAIYCCADDTHGTPIEIKAQQLGIKPEELIANIWKEHIKDFSDFNIKFDSYYSTNSHENKYYAEYIYKKLKEKGLVYTKPIKLIYCNNCKRFLPDRFVKGTCPNCKAEEQYGDVCEKCGTTHKTTDLLNPRCVVCGKKPEQKESTHYFFKLSACKEQLHHFLNSKKLQKEVVNFCNTWMEKLEDWCISRDGPYFGFEIPDSKKETGSVKYFYVWLDAPIGYIASTANYCKNIAKGKDGSNEKNNERSERTIKGIDEKNLNELNEKDYWMPNKPENSEIIHVIGKDIIYFHFLFWPAMLINAGIKAPDQIQVHGFLTVNREKMSKSRGTFLTARHYLNYLDAEYLRYYYASSLPSTLTDIDLDIKDFKEKINHELIGNIGNLANRTISFLNKNYDSMVSEIDIEDKDVQRIINDFNEKAVVIRKKYHDFEYREAVKDILYLSSLGNKYFQEKEPWKLAKGSAEDKKKAQRVLTLCFNLLKNLSILISPIIPAFAERLQKQLNVLNAHSTQSGHSLTWNELHFDVKNHKVNNAEILVKKIENEIEKMINDNVKNSEDKSGKEKSEKKKSGEDRKEKGETNKEFNLDLRVGKVESIIDHPNADKLYILKVNLSKSKDGKHEIRQLVAGIRTHFKKEEVLGKNLVVVCNLAHAKLKGEISEGMLLAAEKDGKLGLLLAEKSKAGDRVYPEKESGISHSDGEKSNGNNNNNHNLPSEFKTITYKEFLGHKFEIKNKEVFWCLNGEKGEYKEKKTLRTDKEKIKVDIDDGAEVC